MNNKLNKKNNNKIKLICICICILLSIFSVRAEEIKDMNSIRYIEIEGENAGNLENIENNNSWEAYVKKYEQEKIKKENKMDIKYTKRIYILIFLGILNISLISFYYIKKSSNKNGNKNKKILKSNKENIF